jgi:predicted NUDIX family NTP pyrophosphohydrolase
VEVHAGALAERQRLGGAVAARPRELEAAVDDGDGEIELGAIAVHDRFAVERVGDAGAIADRLRDRLRGAVGAQRAVVLAPQPQWVAVVVQRPPEVGADELRGGGQERVALGVGGGVEQLGCQALDRRRRFRLGNRARGCQQQAGQSDASQIPLRGSKPRTLARGSSALDTTTRLHQALGMGETSAGLLLYRRRTEGVEVLLVHPGGPFYRDRDDGWWTVPKGLIGAAEEPLAAARREFAEELGFPCPPDGPFVDLGSVKQKGGKTVRAWAVEGDCDPATARSNTFHLEWPPRSGKTREFPEIDRAGFFTLEQARRKINAAQAAFLDRLEQVLRA